MQGSRRVPCAYIRATLAVSTTAFTLFRLNAQILSRIRYPPSPADISRPGLSGISVFALLLVRATSSQFDPSVKCCNAPVTPNTGLDDVRIQTSTIPHCFLANLCYTESYLPQRFWREGWIANNTLQKLAGTNPGIRISSDLSL